ncbi:MAG: OmpA family protein, partial [Patulibacter sp.]
ASVVAADGGVQVSAKGDSASVGCKVTGADVKSCEVLVYARKSALGLVKAGSKNDTLVLVGRGSTDGNGKAKVSVPIKLTKAGRKALERLGRLPVQVNVAITPTSGEKVSATEQTSLRLPETVIVGDAMFNTGSSVLLPAGRSFLDKLARSQVKFATKIECQGHTDSQGDAAENKRLGLARAETVCDYLKAKGVTAKRSTSSFGESKPRASNATPAGRALNRRVELKISYQ